MYMVLDIGLTGPVSFSSKAASRITICGDAEQI
jgi:hypothetical protein